MAAEQIDKDNQVMSEVGHIVATMLSSKFEAVLAQTLERVFSPVAEATKEAALIEILKNKPYLTEKELAMLVPVSTETLRSYRSRGLGPRYIKAPVGEGRSCDDNDGATLKDNKRGKILYPRTEVDNYYSDFLIDTRAKSSTK